MSLTGFLAISDSQLGNIALGQFGSVSYSDIITFSTVNHFTPGIAILGSLTISSTNSFVLAGAIHFGYFDTITFHTTNAYTASNFLSHIGLLTLSTTNSPTFAAVIPPVKWGAVTFTTTNAFVITLKQNLVVNIPLTVTNHMSPVPTGIGHVTLAMNTVVNHFTIKAQLIFDVTPSHTIAFTQRAIRVKFVVASNQVFVAHSLNFIRVLPRSVTHSLTFQSMMTYNSVLNHLVSNTLIFQSGYSKYIGLSGGFTSSGSGDTGAKDQYQWFPVAVARVVPRKSSVVLSTADSVIVLVSPLLNDSQNYTGGNLSIKYSVVGDLYTYLRQTDLQKLQYTFELDRNKSLELRAFIINNDSKIIDLENWKGEHWKVFITNTPSFIPKYRGERVRVNMEFEGVKIAG